MMNFLPFAITLLAAAEVVIGLPLPVTYTGYVLHPKTVHEQFVVDSIDECVSRCVGNDTRGNCGAISYNTAYGHCLITYCGHHVLIENEAFTSKITNDVVVAGVEIPYATHEFPLTDQCGEYSYGSNMETGFKILGLDYKNKNSKLYGNALHYPKQVDKELNTGLYSNYWYYVTYRTDAMNFYGISQSDSYKAYEGGDVSFSIAFYLFIGNIKATNNQDMCFFEFSSSKATSSLRYHYVASTRIFRIESEGWYGMNQWKSDTPIAFEEKKWYHIAATFNSESNLMTLYINGTVASTAYLPDPGMRSITDVTIGGRASAFNSGTDDFFEGSMYCLSMYNETLTAFQVKKHRESCIRGQVRVVKEKHCCC